MKILLIQVIRNEIKMLPWKMKWAKANGLEVFTFDNYSDDGTWQWLQHRKSGARSQKPKASNQQPKIEQLDTGELFSLKLNNKAIMKKFHEQKPDWCIIAGCDMFYKVLDYDLKLNKFIKIVDDLGYNAIDCSRLFNFYYTGKEDDSKNPLNEYYFYEERQDWKIGLIAKYSPELWLDGDQFKIKNETLFYYPNFVCLHYWHRSDARERFIRKWQRRYRSWQNGIDAKDHGGHYPEIIMQDKWVWSPDELSDIRSLN